MIGSLYSGISGLKANTDAMAVIGDNIANVNTTGFKSSRTFFADVLSGVTGNEIGQGVMMTGQNADWTQGAPESTGNATDLAITGDGLFVVHDSSGVEYYTRAGNFQFDNAGNLVTHDGMIVQGYKIDRATGVLGVVSNITIESGNCSPLASNEMKVNLNLNADDTNGLDESVNSTLTVDCINPDSDIIFTAVKVGAAGNDISVKYVDPGAADQTLSVDVTGNAITVNLATDSTGAITSTASEIVAKIEEVGTPSAELVTVAVQGSGGGVVNAATYLSSGGSGWSSATNLGGGIVVTEAELEVDCINLDSDIIFTAVEGGAAGNNITVKYVDPGAASQALDVFVAGNAITVYLATDSLGVITSTAFDIAVAVNTDEEAKLLVAAPEEGTGVVNAATHFTTGGSGCISDTNFINGDSGCISDTNLEGGDATTEAALIVSGTNADSSVTFTAVNAGETGNDISIKYVDPGAAGQTLGVVVDGNAITVNLGTDADGFISSTAAGIATAVAAAAPLLVTAVGGADVVGIKAALIVSGTNADSSVTFTAVDTGMAGNNITVKYVDPGAASQDLSVDVTDNAITITLETDADGFISSTAADIVNFINTDLSGGAVAARALLSAVGGADVVGTKAELEVDCTDADSDITFTAVDTGMAGNNITVKYVDPGVASQDLSVDVTDNAITVNLETDADAFIVSTAVDIVNFISTDLSGGAVNARAIVSAAVDIAGAGVIDITTDSEQLSGGGGAAAELTLDYTNEDTTSDVTFTAVNEGMAGNDISVKYVDPGVADATLGVVVDGNVITVNLETDSTGAIASTAADIATAINSDADASSLVLAVGEGDGVVGTKAELEVDCTNPDSDITFTAVNTGIAGNDISVKYVDPGVADATLGVVVDGNVITVNLETDSTGAIASTAADIATAINSDADASSLVLAVREGEGGGVVDITTDSEQLSGGGGAAQLTVDCTNAGSDVTYVAVNGGIAGNDISVKYVDSGVASQPLKIAVLGNAVTVNLATDNTGAIISTAADIVAAINTDADAALLVFASAEGKDIVEAKPSANLAGGVEVSDNTPDIYSNTITAYDSLGSAVDVTVQYTCVGQGRWVWDVTPSDGLSSSTGVISFDENGKLSYPVTNPKITITGLSNGAENLEIDWNLVGNNNFTGYSLLSSTSSQTQNGYATGMLQSVSVDNEGFVVKTYSNGKLIPGYRIALAGFSSYAGLARTGGNLYSESLASGQPTFGIPGNGGFGGINSRSLEMSNVDLATEFVRMITTQRAFQANSRVITTSDEILQELINLKR